MQLGPKLFQKKTAKPNSTASIAHLEAHSCGSSNLGPELH